MRQARLTAVTCTGEDAVEITVTSADPFPVRDALVLLQVGAELSFLSRYGDDGDLHTLIFTLGREQLAAFAPDATAYVRYHPSNGQDVWLVGPIDPGSALGCDTSPPSESP